MREQPTFRPYLVQVRAANARGFSSAEPLTHLGWSGEDGKRNCAKNEHNCQIDAKFTVPLKAPRDLRLLKHWNHSAVELEWEPVPERLMSFELKRGGGKREQSNKSFETKLLSSFPTLFSFLSNPGIIIVAISRFGMSLGTNVFTLDPLN